MILSMFMARISFAISISVILSSPYASCFRFFAFVLSGSVLTFPPSVFFSPSSLRISFGMASSGSSLGFLVYVSLFLRVLPPPQTIAVSDFNVVLLGFFHYPPLSWWAFVVGFCRLWPDSPM